jgi:hypothetical protein
VSGHTPGPWFNGRQMGNSANAIIGDGDSVVAVLPGAWNHCTHIEADARLIAAAPDLLEALISLLGPDGGSELVRDCAISANQYRAARAAIDKATQP